MKIVVTRQGLAIIPEGVPDELYLEGFSVNGTGAIVTHVPVKGAWGHWQIVPAPPKKPEPPPEDPPPNIPPLTE